MAPSCAVNHQRGDLAGVEVCRHEPGEGGRAELVERGVAGETHLGTGEEGHAEDDPDRAADDGEGTRAEGDLGEDPQDLLLVPGDRARGPGERTQVERQLLTEVVEEPAGTLGEGLQVSHVVNLSSVARAGGRSCS
jgi:hypothetical protein